MASEKSDKEPEVASSKDTEEQLKKNETVVNVEEKKAEEPSTAENKPALADDKGDDHYYPEEEVLEGDWMRPQVDIKEVDVQTGEEDETCFWTHRAKLYRWAKQTSEWKERGIGEAKLLQHRDTQKIRFLLRQEKTLKIVANHYVVKYGSFCQLTPNVGSDKIWVWSVVDFSEDGSKLEQFGLKFGQVAAATEFKEKFEEAVELNKVPFKAFLERTTTDDAKKE